MSPIQRHDARKHSKNRRTIATTTMAIFFICRNNLADLKKNIKRINIEAEGREEETQTEEAETTRK